MARVFAYLMGDGDVNMSDEAIFNDTSETIKAALKKTYAVRTEQNRLTETAFEIALNTLK